MAFGSITAGVHELKLKITAENQATSALASTRRDVAALRKEAAEIPAQITAIDARIADARAKHLKSSDLVGDRNKLLQRQIDIQQDLYHSTNSLAEADTRYNKSTKETAKSMEKMALTTEAMSEAANMLAKAIAAPIIAFGTLAVKNASWAIEMENLFKVTTGKFEEAGQMFSKQFQEMAGVSQTRSKQMIGYLHTMMTSMGQTERSAMDMAKNLVKLGYDISSYYNIDVEQAFDKLMSAMVGLPRGLKTLGVIVTEEIVKQWALDHALIKVGETMTEQQEVYSRYNVILEQTRKAQGDLIRTLTSPQNAIRILNERFYELTITIGKELLPVFKLILLTLQKVTKFFQELPRPVRIVLVALGALTAIAITATAGILGLAKTLLYLGVQLNITALRFATLQTAMGWIGIAAAAITAIVVAIGLFSKNTRDATAAGIEYKATIDQINMALQNEANTIEQIAALEREKRRLDAEERERLFQEDWKRVEKLTRGQRTIYEASRTGLGSSMRIEPLTRAMYEQFTFEEANKRVVEEAVKQRDTINSLREAYEDASEVVGGFGAIQAKVAVELAKTGKVGKIVVIGEKEGEGLIYKKGALTDLEKFIMEMYTAIRAAYKKSMGKEAGPDVFADIAKEVTIKQEQILNELRLMDPAFEQAAVTVNKYKATIDKLKESFITAAKVMDINMFQPEMEALLKAIESTSTEQLNIIDEKTKKVVGTVKKELTFDEIVKGWGKTVYEWVQKGKDVSERFGKPINQYLLSIAERWKKTAEGTEYIKGQLKDAAANARDLGNQLQRALDALDKMRNSVIDFNEKFADTLKTGLRDLGNKGEKGAIGDYMKMVDELYTSPAKKNRLEAAFAESDEKWAKVAGDLKELKTDYEDFIKKQQDALNSFYNNEEQKWAFAVKMSQERVKLEGKTLGIVTELQEAQAKGATEEQLGKIIQRGEEALRLVGYEGSQVIKGGREVAQGLLDETTKAARDMITTIEAYLANIPGLSADAREKIKGLFERLRGIWWPKGARKPSSIEVGLESIPGLLSVASDSLRDFFDLGESGFAVGLTGAVSAFGVALQDISVYYDELEKGGEKFTKNLRTALKGISAEAAGAMGASVGGMISGKSRNLGGVGSLLGTGISMLSKSLGPFGALFSGIGGLIGGLFGKKSKEEKEASRINDLIPKITKNLAYLGKISEETAKSIATAMKTMSEHAATSKYFADVINDVGVNQNNVNKLWSRASEILKDLKNKSLSVGEATKALGDSFTALVEGAKKLGTEGSNAMIKFMESVKASGVKVQEMTDYIDEQLGVARTGIIGAAGGLEMMINGTAKGLTELLEEKTRIEEELSDRLLRGYARRLKEKELRAVMEKINVAGIGIGDDLERIGRLTAATFNEMIENGVSLSDAFESLGPTLDALIERQKLYGLTADASLTQLLKIRGIQKEYEGLFEAIDGNLAVMTALYNVGGLDQSLFLDSQVQMVDYYQQLKAAGLSSEEALTLLIPTMKKINEIAKERGWTLDANAEAIINEAKVYGITAEAELTMVEAILAGFGELIKALTGSIPEAFRKYTDRLNAVDRSEREVEERRRQRREDAARGIDDYSDAVRNAADTTTEISDAWIGVAESTREAARAAREYGAGTGESGGADRKEDTIHGSTGGSWQVTGQSQLFRAHKGETVDIYRPDQSKATSTAPAAPVHITNEFKFDISTIDTDTFEKVVQKKIVPLLEKYTKNETFLIHPNGVRRF